MIPMTEITEKKENTALNPITEGKISKESPLGKAIMNRKVNETFTFISESGRELKVKLLKKN